MSFLLRTFLAICVVSSTVLAAGDFAIKDGDRIVFYGDSITDQRLYTVIAETYIVTRYPGLDVTFVHSGWGGDTVSGGGGGPIDLRLKRDVVANNPTVMTIMLGMNDGHYRAESEDTDNTYFNGYRHIVDSVKAQLPAIRITAIKPSPYDDVTRPPTFPGGYNEVMISFGKWIESYAAKNSLATADLNTGVVAMLRKAYELDPVESQTIIKDRVHPGFSGHLVMAEQLLKAWNARALVSAVTIDAEGKNAKLKSAEHAQVTEIALSSNLSWKEAEDALPLPFAQWTQQWGIGPLALVLRSSDVAEDLNRESLTVTGLKSGSYLLTIDDQKVGTWNDSQLNSGVNLALLETPMTKQAKEVYDLTVSRADVHNARWRTFGVPLAGYSLTSVKNATDAADKLAAEIAAKRKDAARPRAHRFQLTPVS